MLKVACLAQEEYSRKWYVLKLELYLWFDLRSIQLKCIVNNDRIDNVKHGKIQVSGKPSAIRKGDGMLVEKTGIVEMIFHAAKIIGIHLHDNNISNGVISLPFVGVASSVLSDYSFKKKKRHLVNSEKNCGLIYYSYDCKMLIKKLLRIEQKKPVSP